MKTNTIKIIGVVSTIVGVAATLVGNWVNDKKMEEEIALKIDEALSNKETHEEL